MIRVYAYNLCASSHRLQISSLTNNCYTILQSNYKPPQRKKRTYTRSVQVHFFQILHLCLAKFMDSDTEPVSTQPSAYNYKIFFLSLNTMMNNHILMIQ